MAFLDLVSELTGTLPGLSPLLAQTYINRAWDTIQRERRWGFLSGLDGSVVCPALIAAGSYTIVQYQSTVTANAAASAALTPFITGTPLATQLQIRFGGSTTLTAGQIYRIMAVDTTDPTALILTLDRAVVELTNAVSTYQAYRCYITAPAIPGGTFLGWDAIVDMTYGFTLKLNWTSRNFDVVDPQRTSQGDAYYCGFFRPAGPYGSAATADPNQDRGAPIYELWPAPVSGRTFYVRMLQGPGPLVDPDDTQPQVISDDLILQRAYGWHAFPFAAANVGNFPSMKAANWPSLILNAKAEYRDAMRICRKNDQAQAQQDIYSRGHGLRGGSALPFPADANFIQTHLLNF